jgi:hypothetical protein
VEKPCKFKVLKQLPDAIRFRINVQILIGQANIEDLELLFFLETINSLAQTSKLRLLKESQHDIKWQ